MGQVAKAASSRQLDTLDGTNALVTKEKNKKKVPNDKVPTGEPIGDLMDGAWPISRGC
jgi:hypothetical protein